MLFQSMLMLPGGKKEIGQNLKSITLVSNKCLYACVSEMHVIFWLCTVTEKGGLMDVDQEDVMIIMPPLFSPKDVPDNVV